MTAMSLSVFTDYGWWIPVCSGRAAVAQTLKRATSRGCQFALTWRSDRGRRVAHLAVRPDGRVIRHHVGYLEYA